MRSDIFLCGTTIKKISAGGDNLSGRVHGKLETDFIPHYNAFIMANDMPNIDPYDDAIDGRLKCITYSKQFVDNPSNEFELQKDKNIEKEIETYQFKKCFLLILYFAAHRLWLCYTQGFSFLLCR
jgi:phage/plasmid-associated DNA primase